MDIPSRRPTLAPQLHRKRLRSFTPLKLLQYGLLSVLAALSFVVIVMMVLMSLRPTALIYVDFWRLPLPPTLINYQLAILDLLPAMLRTLVITFVSIVGILVLACPAAYALARVRFPGRDLVYYMVLGVLIIPGAILLTPHFVLANQLGLRGSMLGLVVFYIAGGQPFAIFLLVTFFRSQIEELFEAARLDGTSELQALLYIAVPLAWPILVTVAILNFLGIYDDYIWPSLMLPQNQQTLILALESYNPSTGQFTSRPDLGAQTAGYVIATLPQLLLFSLGMKYFVQGLMSGSVKG